MYLFLNCIVIFPPFNFITSCLVLLLSSGYTKLRNGWFNNSFSEYPNILEVAGLTFMNFSNAHRDRIRAQNPDWKMTDVARELGRLWREMSDREKSNYQT